MSLRSRLPQSRRHIMVYDEDWEIMEKLFGNNSSRPLGVGKVVKEIIHRKCLAFRAALADKLEGQGEAETTQALGAEIVKIEEGAER